MSLAVRQTAASTRETIYWPSGTPRGGIVCLHGSEGGWAGWNDLTCALFAANGFVALSRNYTRNAQWLTHPNIDDVPLEDTEAALMALRLEMASFGCGVGLFGASRGAEHALLLAQLLAEDGREVPKAVAVHSPPDVAWPAFIVSDFQTGKPWAGDQARPAWSWRGGHERTRPGTLLCPGPIAYPILITQGVEDQTWGAGMARSLVARIKANGCVPEAHFFEGEGHVFRAEARNKEWDLMADFFGQHLAPESSR